jgi:uncharacterized protein (DUF1330 family)
VAAYIIANVRITDPERFAAYAKAIAGMSERYGGESVVKGVANEILEGEAAPGERIIVSRFPDAEAIRRYIGSDEYQAAKALREGAAVVVMRVVAD